MKSFLKEIVEKERQREQADAKAIKAEIANPSTPNDRRNFLKKAAFGGIALGGLMNMSIEDTIAMTTQKVSRASNPSDLKITDMRIATTTVLGRTSIIRIDTNQGIYGLGEVRDGADKRYALMLKSRIMGQNPCNVEKIFKIIKQFGHHARQGGGVCAVEMACWDLVGKAYGVPCWQLLGGRYRDSVRLYADTPGGGGDLEEQKKRVAYRVMDQGYSWLKMDLGIGAIRNVPGALVNQSYWSEYDRLLKEAGGDSYMAFNNIKHPFTQIQITDKGLEEMGNRMAAARDLIGWDIPIFADHFGHFDYNNGIRLGRVLEKYRLACMEDVIPWFYTEDWKKLSDALETPMMTGEDIYLLEGFKPLIHTRAVDIVHPDLATSGGLLETKRIGDYAEENGIAMAMHQAGTPVSFMANVHCAAATQNVLALEHHSVDLNWWESMVRMTGKRPIIEKGYAPVPLDSPGLGIELNDAVVKEHLRQDDPGYFLPTPEWDLPRTNDRLWS